MKSRIEVDLDLPDGPVHAGSAHFSSRRGTTFTYAPQYLARRGAYALDPALPLTSGSHPVPGLPGAFADASPDRWGQRIITRRQNREARDASRTTGTVTAVDLLLGVSDLTRQGALRFRSEAGSYVHDGADVPKLIELPRLLDAARRFEKSDGEDQGAVNELLEAGSSGLGGARPKASVRDGDQYAIAKFPHQNDQWNVIAWEAATLDLAGQSGIHVPKRRLERIGGSLALVLDRFDRKGSSRIGYISAKTMLREAEGNGGDYLDLAETMDEFSEDAAADRLELYRRIVFSLAVNNTDDHLRNHGFLRGRSGWRLSPVFDVNPHPYDSPRQTSLGGALMRSDVAAALGEYGEYLVRRRSDRDRVIREVSAGVTMWRAAAERAGIEEVEIQRFRSIFEGRPVVKP